MRDVFPKPTPRYRVTLACGCTVTARDMPPGYTTRYICRNGLGHGYRLAWTSCTDTIRDHTTTNPETPQ